MTTFYLGIDPGKTGGVSLLGEAGDIMCVDRFDNQDPLDVLAEVLRGLDLDRVMIFLEAVHAAPGQGVVSMFSFGVSYGSLQGWLKAMGLEFDLVSPQAWQRWLPYDTDPKKRVKLGLKDKHGLDTFIFERCRVPHQGAMDATAIAEYGRLVATGAIDPPVVRPTKKRKIPIRVVV